MTFRSKSRRRQWRRWLCAALVAFAVQAVATCLVLGAVSFDLLDPDCYRLALPIVLVFGLLAWETRWDGVVREEDVKVEGQEKLKSGVEVEERNLTTGAAKPPVGGQGLTGPFVDATSSSRQNKDEASSDRRDGDVASTKERSRHSSTSTLDFDSSLVHRQPQPPTSTSSLAGEALFDQACALPHQEIPDFEFDDLYLDLLGQSAAAGYAPALATLGEHAMRRAAWVEAYYWMSMARRQGMQGLANVMREIRRNWSLDGFPDEAENVYQLFTTEAGSIGRALLHVDSGHEAAKAKEFLKENHPEFLTRVS